MAQFEFWNLRQPGEGGLYDMYEPAGAGWVPGFEVPLTH